MNKTEAAYAAHLEILKQAKEIIHYEYEPLTLRLSDSGQRISYTPDFIVLNKESEIEAHEVKGFWREDARLKIALASEQFWWVRFKSIERGKPRGTWKVRDWPANWA